MRLKDIGVAEQRTLHELARRVSRRLTAEFTNLPGDDGPNIGVVLRENGRTVTIGVAGALLQQAAQDASSREAIRQRIKTRRDRMMFRPETIAMEQHVPARSRAIDGFGGGRGRR